MKKEIKWGDWDEIQDEFPFQVGDKVKVIKDLYMWCLQYNMWYIVGRVGQEFHISNFKYINPKTELESQGKIINIPYDGWVFKLESKWPWYKYEEGCIKKKLQVLREYNDMLPKLGPGDTPDIRYNPPMFNTNIGSNELDRITGFKTEFIDDDYFKEPRNKKRRKRLKRFKDVVKEGAGFGNVDYMNVTGDATSSGYLNDNQPLGSNGSSNIATDLPRGNWHEPSTVIIGFKDYIFKDPYFLKRRKKKRKRKETWEDEILKNKIKKINKNLKKDYIKED